MRKSSNTICLTRPPYPEFFLKVFANDGMLSYKAKCISTGFILYIIGLGITFFSGTLESFLADIGFLTSSILAGIIIFGVFSVCKQIDPTLSTMDKVIGHSKNKKFVSFLEKWNNEPAWFMKERYWYHLQTLSLSILIALWSYVGIIGNYGWVIETTSNRLYHIFWSAAVGYVAGVAINRYGNYTFLISEYGRDFLDPEKLDFISPNTRTAFTSLGKLALRADLVFAIPTVIILVHSLVGWTQARILPFSKPWHLSMTIVYMCSLIFIFFFPLRNAHICMAEAKRTAIERINAHLSLALTKTSEKIDAYATIGGLLSVRDRLAKMSTWPLDLKSAIGASTIFLLPVFTGAVIQLLLEYVLSGILG